MKKILLSLFEEFIKKYGRKPNNLEKILLQQKALKQSVDERKIVSMVDRQPVNPNKPILGGKNVPETEAQIKTKLEGMNKQTVERIRRKRYQAALKAEREKSAKDPDYLPKVLDPEDFAYGGIAGMLGEPTYADDNHRVPYKDAKLVEGETYIPPKNIYGLGIGPGLDKFMREGVPRDEEGFHTTLSKEDLEYLWDVLQGEHPIEDIEDKLMFSFDRFNPEEESKFHVGIGKDKAEIGFKKKTDFINKLFGKGIRKAGGGRVPLGKGKLALDAARRAFLKLTGGAVAGTVAAKSGLFSIFKGGGKKQVVETLTSVPIKDISGMPSWFKPLVNKVIAQGDDVTKKFGTVDREIVHKTKLPDSQTDVIVTQNLDSGDVVVDIGLTKHGFPDGHLGQPVRLEYKAAEEVEPILAKHMDPKDPKGFWKPHKDQKTKEEFWVEEAEFTGGHPENIKFEESTIEKFGDHGSNFDEVEMFATGKVKKTKPTKKAERTEYESGKAEADAEAYWEEHGDYASGGRVPLKKGKVPKGPNEWLEILDIDWDDMDPDEWVGILRSLGVKGHATGGRVPMWLGGGLTKGKRTLSELLKYMSKGSSHGKTPSEMLYMINPKQFNQMLDRPEGIPSIAKEMIEKYTKEMKIDRANMIEDLIGTGRKIKKVDDNLVNLKIKIIEDMASKGVDRKIAKEMADNIAEMASNAARKKATPKITDRGLLEMENIQKNLATKDRKLNASGGLAGMLGE